METTAYTRPSTASLERLPDEVAQAVLLHLDPATLVKVERLNRRFNSLVKQPSLWRGLCRSEYRFWDERHRMKHRLQQPLLETDWRDLLIQRKRLEASTIAPAFEDSLNSTAGRLARRDAIVTCGYDAKDYLLKQLDVDEQADDYLARHFWARIALGQVENRVAIRELIKLRSGQDVPLERALACIDLCILHRAPMTLDDVSAHIDRLADAFKAAHPHWASLVPRELARQLCTYLKEGAYFGVRSEASHHDLQNNLITVALLEHDHPALPFVSCAVYGAVAKRLGLAASPSNFPRRVIIIVSAPPGMDLDGAPAATTATTSRPYDDARFHAYLDPLSDDLFLEMAQLQAILRENAIPRVQHTHCISPAPAAQMVLRAANNIQYSREVSSAAHSTLLTHPAPTLLPDAPPTLPVEVGPTPPINTINLVRLLLDPSFVYTTNLPAVLQKAQQDLYLGAHAMTTLLLPLLHAPGRDDSRAPARAAEIDSLVRAWLEQLAAHDAGLPRATRRDQPDGARDARFRVGTYFRHRRWDYAGVVTGWDRACAAPEAWMRQNSVDQLPGGRSQVFYNVCDEAGGARYVAEENIEDRAGDGVVPHPGVLRAAGQWCRRWDGQTGRFVSNVRDAYPDD